MYICLRDITVTVELVVHELQPLCSVKPLLQRVFAAAAVWGQGHGAVRRARRYAGERRPQWLAWPLFILCFPPLSERAQGLNAEICQRSTTCRGRGVMLLQDYWNPIFITTGQLRDACIVLLLHSTERRAWGADVGEVACWKWNTSDCVPFITGLFILVNIKQKQQQNQELTSSRSCNYRFSYTDKLIYNGCHRVTWYRQ